MLKPLRDHLIVSATKTEEKTASGLLYKPATIDERVITGKVMAVGSGHLTDSGTVVPLEVVVGDTVVFNKTMAVEAKYHDEVFYILREENVLSVAN